MNLAEPFLAVLREQGDKPAICEPSGHEITFAELHRQIHAFAARLQARGFTPGDAVVIQAPSGIAFTVSTVAALALGGVAVLCEPGLGDEVYLGRLAAAKPRWVFVHPVLVWANQIPGSRALLRRRELHVPPLMKRQRGLEQVVISNRMLERLAARHDDSGAGCPVVDRDERDDAIIIFTGGTTSVPKGVRLPHGALRHYLANIAGIANELPVTRFLADTPQQVLYGLQLGHSVLVTKGRTQKRAAFVLRALREGRVDAYFGSPFLWVEMMAQTGPERERLPGTLKAVLLGGAPVTPEFLRALREWLHPDTQVRAIYGLTEAGPVCVATDEEKLNWDGPGDYVGRALDGIRLELADVEGSTGEVVVHSSALYTGYLGEPERAPEEGLRTGDLGRIVERGGGSGLELLGRKKDMIIRDGVNVYPSTVEPLLRAIAGPGGEALLRECALIGLWNEDRQDEEIVLCYEPAAGQSIDEGTLRAAVERVTGSDAAPDHYLEVKAIPVTGRQNKINKQALRKLASTRFGLPMGPGTRS